MSRLTLAAAMAESPQIWGTTGWGGEMFASFRQVEGELAALQLVLAMLGMGATLQVRDFQQIGLHYRAIGWVLVAQFLIGPLAAAAAGWWLPLPAGVALGVLLLAAMPSGAISNIFAHLGHGNLALSITATVASTVTCLLCTPLLLGLLAENAVPAGFQMPVRRIAQDVLYFLLLPTAVGMLIRRRWPRIALPVARWMVRASLVVLATIAAGSLGSGRIEVGSYGILVPVVLAGFAFLQFTAARTLTWAAGYSAGDSYTLAIEVAVRNANLAILLSSTLFSGTSALDEELGAGALYVALFYGGASLVLAIVAASSERFWRGSAAATR